MGRGHYIAGRWVDGTGPELSCANPVDGSVTWRGRAAGDAEVDAAVEAARGALADWADATLEARTTAVRAYGQRIAERREDVALAISRDTGKPLWESRTEAGAMVNKIELSIRAYNERRHAETRPLDGGVAATRFRPHGVCAVLGPFNLPGHLPNGHIVPALIAGNTVVLKPSEEAAAVGELMTEIWETATRAAPLPGVWNTVQGGRDTGAALSGHDGLDGLFFTGSSATGLRLARAFAETPWKILALEMGGNNPLVVWGLTDAEQRSAAVATTLQSAYITAGQRCTCARRLIVQAGDEGEAFVDALADAIDRVIVGPYNAQPEPFMGPVIHAAAAERLLSAQASLRSRGGRVVREMKRVGGCSAMLSPGLIDVTGVPDREDEEYFGPLLQVIRVGDFDAAIAEANRTRYGLSAALLSPSRDLYDRFYRAIRAGVVNWNQPTTGARGDLPFGGIGASGNHRPSGYYAADYCAYPVASIERDALSAPGNAAPGMRP